MSKDKLATFPLQAIIDSLITTDEHKIVVAGFKGKIPELCLVRIKILKSKKIY